MHFLCCFDCQQSLHEFTCNRKNIQSNVYITVITCNWVWHTHAIQQQQQIKNLHRFSVYLKSHNCNIDNSFHSIFRFLQNVDLTFQFLLYSHLFNALFKHALISPNCYIYSNVKENTLNLLQKLSLLSVFECSGKSPAVDHCSPKQSAVVRLYFHCTFNASISSEGLYIHYQSNGILFHLI